MIGSNIGRYQIIEEIGHGGMARVYRAFDPRFKRDIAIKVMTRDLLEDPTLRARFEREAQTIASLEHPAIVPVYDFGEDENRPYLVMRLMTGGTLTDRLMHGPMGINPTVKILRRIGSALERAHNKGIIHRDLKPSNIMFDDYGDAFLADFGIARLTESAITLTGDSVVGTPAYMSPEQIHGDKEIDGRSDIYALGIICFEMLTGRRPFEDTTPTKVMMKHIIDPVPAIREVNPDLPEGVDELINRSLAKEPTDRYTTASELTATLESLSREEVADSLAAQEGTIVAATVMGALATAEETEVTEASEGQATTEIALPSHDEEYPDTEIITPAFPVEPATGKDAGQEEAYPDTEVVAPDFVTGDEVVAGHEEAYFETEVAAPAFAASATEAGASAETGGQSGGKKWLIVRIAGGFILILLIAAVIAGGFFLSSRDQGTEVVEEGETPTVEVVSAGGQAQEATKTPKATATINAHNRAEVQMQIFYRKVDGEAYDEALEAINQAIELVPEESWYFHERAWLYSLIGDFDAALNNINRAIELSPADADNIARRGALQLDMGNYNAAIEDLQLAIRRNRGNPYYHSDLGRALLAKNDFEGALAEFEAAVQLAPDESGFLGSRADIYLHFGDVDAAFRDITRAVHLNPDEAWHHDQLAGIYAWYLGDFEKALEQNDQAIELDPESGWRYNDRASILREMGRIDEALANHEEAIARDPEDIWNQLNLAITYRDFVGDNDAALRVYEQAAATAPDFADIYSERGHTYQYAIGDMGAALADFERAAEMDPENPARFNSLAILYRDMGDLEAAMANHERAIALDPEDSRAHIERGYTLRDMGQDAEGALTEFNRAIEIDPFNADALLARALLYGWDLGEHDPAFVDLERCHEVDPTFYWCFFEEAWLRDDVGDTDAAAVNFERYLELVPEFDCPDCQEDARNYIRQNG